MRTLELLADRQVAHDHALAFVVNALDEVARPGGLLRMALLVDRFTWTFGFRAGIHAALAVARPRLGQRRAPCATGLLVDRNNAFALLRATITSL